MARTRVPTGGVGVYLLSHGELAVPRTARRVLSRDVAAAGLTPGKHGRVSRDVSLWPVFWTFPLGHIGLGVLLLDAWHQRLLGGVYRFEFAAGLAPEWPGDFGSLCVEVLRVAPEYERRVVPVQWALGMASERELPVF